MNLQKSYNSEKCKTAVRLKLDFQYIDNLLVGHKYTCVYIHIWDSTVLPLLLLCDSLGEEQCSTQ